MSDFLESQTPQGSVDEETTANPVYIDNLVISGIRRMDQRRGYQLLFLFMELRCPLDDAHKGGNGTEDGDVFHALEISQGIMTTAWNISDIWQRLYNSISRANMALKSLNRMDEATYPEKAATYCGNAFSARTRTFPAKAAYKKIVIANDETLDRKVIIICLTISIRTRRAGRK